MRQTSEAEYSEFARSVWPQLYRTAVIIVGDRQLAEDLVQSALVKTYIAWPRLAGDRQGACVHPAGDGQRRPRLVPQAFLDAREHRQHGTDDGVPTGDHSAATVNRVTLADVLKTLPLGQRSVIALRFLDDLSVQETADLLNVTSGTVKSQTADALAALRSHVHLVPEGSHHD